MSQVALTALDAWSAREWREKERGWRAEKMRWRDEEMAFRAEERRIRHLERLFLDRQLRHRDEDIRQRRVDNSRYLWCRFAELNRLDVGEKSEQLRSLSWLTALIASFTFTSPVEFNYGSDYIPTARLTAYAICAALVPSLMTISSILCMYLLGSILKMGKWFVAELPEEEFMADCREYAEMSGEKGAPPAPRRTFERFWDCRCEDGWKTSFRLFVCGISSFLALLCTMAFIKFSINNVIAILFSAVIAVFFVLWLGAQVTWGSYLMTTQADSTSSTLGYRLLYLPSENPFKWHLCPVLRSELTDVVSDSAQAEDTEGELLIQDNPEALPI